MIRPVRLLASIFIIFAGLSTASPALEQVPDFILPGLDGSAHRPFADADTKAVVIVAFMAGCPILRRSIPNLKSLSQEYSKRGIAFYFVDPAYQDGSEIARKEVREFGVSNPVLIDPDQTVTSALGLSRSAEAVIVRNRDRRIIYRGAVDDQFRYEGQLNAPRHRYVVDALESLLAGREPEVAESQARGCLIYFKKRKQDAAK